MAARWSRCGLVVVLVGLLASCTRGPDVTAASQTSSTAAPSVATSGPTTAPSTTTTTTSRPDPAGDGLDRVLIVGDSLVFGAIEELDREITPRGVETRYVGYSGTGLLSGNRWWGREITAQVEAWSPDVVVIEACCNYAANEPKAVTEDGRVVEPESEEMYAIWAEAAVDALARARAGGADVYWVTTPCVGGSAYLYETRVARFNDTVDLLGVPRVDWAAALCPGGEFTSSVGGVEVRTGDGLHLTDEGDGIVAATTWAAISPSFVDR